MVIQIVEDDKALSDGIVLALQEPGIEFVQSTCIGQAIEIFQQNILDLVILDVNLPDGNGYDYLKWIRERSELPVLMLTANDMEMDEVKGLSLGADDYMTKPFSLAVLRARIKTLLRRAVKASDNLYQEADFIFDFDKLIFTKKGQNISLSVNEQKLLKMLLENRERILTRNMLLDRLWGDGCEYVEENALSVTVNRLRSKLEDKYDKVSFIQTVYGQGYAWKPTEKL